MHMRASISPTDSGMKLVSMGKEIGLGIKQHEVATSYEKAFSTL